MSSPGFNPLAIVAPDLYAKQIAIQRQQALAQSLLQQGEGNPGSAQYGGLRNAGNMLLGAFLAKRGDQSMANLYAPQPDASQATSQPSGQVSNAPTPMPQGSPDAAPLSAQSGPTPQISNAPSQQPANVAMGQALTGRPKTIPDAMNGMIPDLPGLSHTQSMLAYFQSPQAYFTALAAAKSPTSEQKNAGFVYPNDPAAQQSIVGAGMTKAGAIPVNRGVTYVPDGHGGMMPLYAPPVAPEGYQNQAGPNGQVQVVPSMGGPQAVAGSQMAHQTGTAAATPAVGYDNNGMPQATNALAMTGNPAAQALIPGMNPAATQSVESGGNPYAVSPAGARGPMQTMPGTLQSPGFGVQPAQNGTPQEQGRVGTDYLGAMQQKYQNPVLAHIAYNMGPAATDKWIAAGGDFSKLPQETQMYLGRIAVAQALPQRQQQSGAASLSPALPASQQTYMAGQGKDASDRHDATVAAAAESPMRINVLDNIIKLSQSGVGTGPGAEFQNSIKGYLANTPGLGKLLGSTQANVGNFQELQKFMYQNALRNWQAAGGTGTDSQLESAAKANPNDHLFPQALQTIAKWGKASELAVQGKANAQDAFLSQNGQTPANQIKFESTWRNAFDPKVFQYSLMNPQEKQTFAQQDLKTPQAAKAFIAKQQSLKQLGALQ